MGKRHFTACCTKRSAAAVPDGNCVCHFAYSTSLFSEARALCTAVLPERGSGGAGNCRVEHNRGLCRTHELCALPRPVCVRSYGACARFRCANAAWLCSGARVLCTAATGIADVTALAIAELSTTEGIAACMSCLLCRGLFSCGPVGRVHDNDAWVQQRCSVVRVMCAQLPLDSQM